MPLPLWLVTLVISAALSLIRLDLGKSSAVYLSAWWPLLLVVIFDIIAGVGVLFGLSAINGSGPQVPAIWPAVTAGLLGSSLIRTNVKLPFGKRSQLRLVGVLRKLQESAERDLNEQCAIAESEWITNKVMPTLVNVELGDLIDWAKQYLEVQRLVLGDKNGAERRGA